MKILIVLAVLIGSATAIAGDNAKQMQAQMLFDSMSADEAADSSRFRTRVWNINMPGSSTWFKPSTSLCIDGDSVRTIYPFKKCTLWQAKKDGDVKTFNSQSKADDWGSAVKCVASTSKILSTPINYSYTGCVQWGVKTDKIGPNKVKYFNYKSQADNFAEDNSSAKGNAFCSQEGVISKTMPTTYVMEFYRKVSGIKYDNKYFLGEHVYPIAQCDL